MKSLRQRPTVLKEPLRQRPDCDTFTCVNAECQLLRHTGAHNLVIWTAYGHDRLRLLRCRTCGEACSARRGTALCNPKRPETTAEDVITHLEEGCSVRATARLVQVATATVARLWRVAGRHAQRFHGQPVHGLPPRALACAEQGSFVKKSRDAATPSRRRWLALYGTTVQ